MRLQKIQKSDLKNEYNILCQRIYPFVRETNPELNTPYGMTYCEIVPGNFTSRHNHYEGETFVILKGRGEMIIEDEKEILTEGHVVFIPPFTYHKLTNLSDENLVFLSVYWETADRISDDRLAENTLIFSAPPTPNGELHLGHLSGPYLAADVYRRFLKLNGYSATYVSGSDDHQSYVPMKGKKLALSPDDTITKYVPAITGVLEKFDAAPDKFLRPRNNADYITFVQNFFDKLVDNGTVRLEQAATPYCETCSLYLYEAHISGGCPYCGQATNGNGCEACGIPNDCTNLVNPKCNHCQNTPISKVERKYFFDLETQRKTVEEIFANAAMPPPLRQYLNKLLNQILPKLSVSHVAEWGIPLSEKTQAAAGAPQVIYEWLEMAAGYLYQAPENFWKDPNSQVVECFGFDNGFFYLAFVPALLNAFDADVKIPKAFLINQFYLLEGKKFSTSRNHAIWGTEALEVLSPDAIRYYLGKTRSESVSTNFELNAMLTSLETELMPWTRLVDEVTKATAKVAPTDSPALTTAQRAFEQSIHAEMQNARHSYSQEHFRLNSVVAALDSIVTKTRDFLQQEQALGAIETYRAQYAVSVGLATRALRALAIASGPLLSRFSEKVLGAYAGDSRWQTYWLPISESKPKLQGLEISFSSSIAGLKKLIATRNGSAA